MDREELFSSSEYKVFYVQGETGKYVVSINYVKGEYKCTCPNFLFRKNTCKHIEAIING